MNYNIKQDCRYFKGDIPCFFHKEQGVHCKTCKHYSPIKFKILIIKLDAPGDVLRTTCILQGLKEKYPNSYITWITKRNSFELFKNNHYIDCLLDVSLLSYIKLKSEGYDVLLSLDSSPLGAQIATLACAKEKLGFGYDNKGFVYPFNKEAEEWYEMGIFDDVKRANSRTYQEIILDICKLKPYSYEIIFSLERQEREFALSFAKKNNLSGLIIGLNTGAGGRWKNKKWTRDGFIGLINLIEKNIENSKILLLGGLKEVERNRYLKEMCPNVIDTGCDNTIREFGALVSLCDILITGDTLCLHIACALEKKIVALFGPTSYNEIDLYNRGKKVYPKIDCLCCYKNDCNVSPNCMELIKPDDVFLEILSLIKTGTYP
ncbi:MAG: glycosyltransferase family 9 protein [bacterium]